MTCDDYLFDPETNAEHLASCDSCRAIAEELDARARVRVAAIDVDALPMAAWEGAAHRTWPLVAIGVVSLVTLAIVLTRAAGVSVAALTSASVAGLPSFEAVIRVLQLTGRAIGGPLVAVLFVAFNALLFVLLRRAPRGVQ